MTHRVLIIASDYPPLAGTNTQRVQSFVRHLPKFGWEPIVISRAAEDLALIDSSQLLRLGKNAPIYRVPDPDLFARLRRRRGKRAVDIHALEESTALVDFSVSQANPAVVHQRSAWGSSLSLASEAVMLLCRYFSYLPDALAPWARAATRQGIRVCHEHTPQVVLASAPSYSCLIAGLAVAEECKLPFVADFRDLWVGRPYRRTASRWHDWWDHYLERRVVIGARRIIVASPAWLEHFQNAHGNAVAEKCVVITNGYDESLICQGNKSPIVAAGVTMFLNTGAMYGSESPAPFLEALGNVLLRRPDLRNKIHVRLIGYAGDDEKSLRQLLIHRDLNGVVELTGPRPHDSCLYEQRKADVLLLFSGAEHRNTISGKSFEYMSTGKPILALIHQQGIQAELLRNAGTARIVQHGDVAATEHAIEDLLLGGKGVCGTPNWAYIRTFERSSLTHKLSATLDQLVPE